MEGVLLLVWLLLLAVNTSISFPSTSNSSSLCDACIREEVSRLLQDPKALSLPYARAFLAREFDKALYVDYIFYPGGQLSSGKDTKVLEIPPDTTELTIHVATCDLMLEQSTTSSVAMASQMDICKVSLYARLVGPSVIATETAGSRTDVGNYCEFKLTFSSESFHRLQGGTYELETIVMWINESEEPSNHIRARDKESRINDGSVIHLGGLGTHPFHAINATHKYHNFTGFLLQGHSKSVYLVTSNDEKRAFASFNALLELGYGEIEILRVPETFLGLFASGKDIVEGDKNDLGESIMKTRSIHNTNMAKELISKINEHTVLTVDSPSRTHAAVFYSTPHLEIKGNGSSSSSSSSSVYGGSKQASTCSNDNAMLGRWIKDSSCSQFVSDSHPEPVFESVPVGHICRHSIPVYAKSMPWFYSNRAKNLVWRPYECELKLFPLDSPHPSVNDTQDTKTIYPSTLQHAMRQAGVGLFAGFGDSLGDEQRDDIVGR